MLLKDYYYIYSVGSIHIYRSVLKSIFIMSIINNILIHKNLETQSSFQYRFDIPIDRLKWIKVKDIKLIENNIRIPALGEVPDSVIGGFFPYANNHNNLEICIDNSLYLMTIPPNVYSTDTLIKYINTELSDRKIPIELKIMPDTCLCIITSVVLHTFEVRDTYLSTAIFGITSSNYEEISHELNVVMHYDVSGNNMQTRINVPYDCMLKDIHSTSMFYKDLWSGITVSYGSQTYTYDISENTISSGNIFIPQKTNVYICIHLKNPACAHASKESLTIMLARKMIKGQKSLGISKALIHDEIAGIVLRCDEIESYISQQNSQTNGIALYTRDPTSHMVSVMSMIDDSTFSNIIPRIDRLTFRLEDIYGHPKYISNANMLISLECAFHRKQFNQENNINFLNPHMDRSYIYDHDNARTIEPDEFDYLVHADKQPRGHLKR